MKPKLYAAIGTSAGGLKEIEVFIKNMPESKEIAFVIIQHLSPLHKSILAEIVSRFTRMKVMQVKKKTKVHANRVYVIPPDKLLTLENGNLILSPMPGNRKINLPVDVFFQSLAIDQADKAVAIVLSGTGTDGANGVKTIKENGGLTVAQDPETADYDGMPNSAIETGKIDFVAPVEEIPNLILDYLNNNLQNQKIIPDNDIQMDTYIQQVFQILKAQTGNDFSGYKKNTLYRRIERRLRATKLNDLKDYISTLHNEKQEVYLLFREFLIGVTSFFRDSDVFIKINNEIIPELISNSKHETIRVWVPACATGEEAYTLAILIKNYLDSHRVNKNLQIFASDIDTSSIEIARDGIYKENLVENINPTILNNYFIKEKDGYRVKKVIRESVIFADQNLLQDPPYSNLDMISCRNLLIYFDNEYQSKALSIFHYGLKKNGILLLGNSESLGVSSGFFETLDRKLKIFRKIESNKPEQRLWDLNYRAKDYKLPEKTELKSPVSGAIKTVIQQRFIPPTIVVDHDGEMIYVQGKTGKFLENPTGEVSTNILKNAREGLKIPLSNAIRKAKNIKKEITHKNVRVKTNGAHESFDLTVIPLQLDSAKLLMIFFQPSRVPEKENNNANSTNLPLNTIAELENELAEKEQFLQNTIEELETSNEELKSANEEAQSTNEELQSTNEELETSKEELQSVNEELATTNNELKHKVDELNDRTNHLRNLLAATDIATIFLDSDLKIFSFTPAVSGIIDLLPSDIGRSIRQFNHSLQYPDLIEDSRKVLKTHVPLKTEVADHNGKNFWMRIIPYKTIEEKVEGVVITFTDITEKKKQEEELRKYQTRLEEMVREKSKALAESEARHKKVSAAATDYSYSHAIDANGNLTLEWYFGAFEKITGYKPEQMVTGDDFAKLIHPDDISKVQERLTDILKGKTVISELRIITKTGELKWIRDKGVPEWDQVRNRVVRSMGTATEITERKQFEQKLIESELKFRNIAENVPGLVLKYKLHADGTDELVYLSKTVEEIYEIPYDKVAKDVGLLWKRIHKDDLEEYTKSIEKSAKNLSFWEREHRIQMPDGRVKWLLGRAVPNKLADGSIVWDTLGIDITEKKEISQALQRSELKFREIYNSSSEAILLHDDTNGTVVDCNDVAVQMYGCDSKEDILGFTVNQFSAGKKGFDEKFISKHIAKAIKKGTHTFEWLAKKKNGKVFWVEVSLKKTFINQKARILAVVRDISERKTAEEEIKKSERLFRSIFEDSPSAILIADDKGNYLEANEAAVKMLGYSHDEIKRMNVAELKTISGTKLDKWYNDYIKTGKEFGEFAFYDKQGNAKYVLYNAVRIKPNLKLSIMSDISERKEMEKQLVSAKQRAEESDRLKSAFLANMSHEIRTPMNGIIGFTNLLQKADVKKQQSHKYLELIDKSGKRLLDTINDIIRISKIESNQEKVTLSKFSLFELMNELYEFFQLEAEMRSLKFTFQPQNADKNMLLNTDREKIYSILTNLITNAIKYTRDGEVKLGYSFDNGSVEIYVEDTGIGIPADKQKRIFNRFERIEDDSRASTEGSGLGLSIVKAYLEMLGSSVSLKSEFDKGTRFSFKLPCFKKSDSKSGDNDGISEREKNKFKDKTILLVDDDPTSLTYMEAILGNSFKTIHKAKDGRKAIETIHKFPGVDYILMDIKMPNLNGYEATREIRKFNKNVKIIAQTAFALEGDRDKALEAGCNDYIAKPVDENRLYEILQKHQK